MKTYKRPTSYSQNKMFEECPRSWYMKYILKIPEISDLSYAHRGNVVHECLELYYKDKTISVDDIKKEFVKKWKQKKLDETNLCNKKDETWLMIINGIQLNYNVTSVEMKIFFPDVVAYLDIVDTQNGVIRDWKTSTVSQQTMDENTKQLKFYSWLFYRKFKELPKQTTIEYLKYTGSKAQLEHMPTMEDVLEMEKWNDDIRNKMNYYLNHPEELPEFNQGYFFSPYKHLWDLEFQDPQNIMSFVVDLYGNFFYVNGMDEFLKEHFNKKYSYELKTAFFIKKRNPNANTFVRLFFKKYNRFPIGFYEEVMKSLHDYAEFKKKNPVIKVNDKRKDIEKKIEMPDKLLSGKVLRDYQLNAVDTFINRNNISILELSTGSGKSLIATEIIRRLATPTLFVVDKKELLIQMKETLEENLKIPIGVLGAGKKDIQDITVATIQTLNKNLDEYKEYLKGVNLLSLDECHHASADSYFKLGSYTPNTHFRLSLSATAFRDDGNDMKMHAVAGPISFSLTGQDLIEQGYLMKPDVYFIKYDIPKDYEDELERQSLRGLINETPDYSLYYPNFVVNNKIRNEKIKTICDNHEGKNILILVKRVEHGQLLEKLIPNSKYVYGETNNKEREQALIDFKNEGLNILISTISIFAEGVDIPSLDVVVNASANRGDVKSIQVLGRVLRKCSGKDRAIYYDFADSGKFFYNAGKARADALKNEGHNLEYIKI